MAKKPSAPKKSESGQVPSRRYARERVMQTLYAALMSEEDFSFLCDQIILQDDKLDETGKTFAMDLAKSAMQHRSEFETMIEGKSANWDIQRIAMIDRALLYMAIAELKYFKDIPPKVTIDEAIEIAKRFSTGESGRFINGILDAVLDDLKGEGSLGKRGRGLRDA